MLKTYLLPALTTGALMMTLVACQPSTTTPETPEAPVTEDPMTDAPAEGGIASGDRAVYSEVPVPDDDTAVGADPTDIALEVFGSTEPGEGNFEEEVELIEETDDQALVLLTQTGLADDSVNGMRYRLEFVPEGDQWRLDWAGRQVRCQQGRGSQDWTTELCS